MTEKLTTNPNQSEIPSTPMAYFWYVSKPFKWTVFGAIILVIMAAAASQSSAYFFKLIVDSVEIDSYQSALRYALLYPVFLFVVQLLYRGSGWFGISWIVKSEKHSYDLLSNYIMQHSHAYFSDRFAGSVLSKINNVTGAVDRVMSDFLWTHLNTVISLLVTIGFLLSIHVWSAVIFIFLIGLLIMLNYHLAPVQAKYSRVAAQSATDLRARIVDTVGNVQAVRQYARTTLEGSQVESFSEKLRLANFKNYKALEYHENQT